MLTSIKNRYKIRAVVNIHSEQTEVVFQIRQKSHYKTSDLFKTASLNLPENVISYLN